MNRRILLTWLNSWKAYAVRCESGGVIGLVRLRAPFFPFRSEQVDFLNT